MREKSFWERSAFPDEIQEIASKNFPALKNRPCSLNLGFIDKGSKYDDLIAGWIQYWSDVLKPDELLDPNLVKALIASESGFSPTKLANRKDSNSARGLMQITNETRKLFVNICAGVRWLFEKKRLTSSRLKKSASWIDTVWEYKGARIASKEELENIKRIFNKFYQECLKCGKG